jgi:Zn-dependent M28 family amino/carboxypeptidase/predicted small lipoprotein YifL
LKRSIKAIWAIAALAAVAGCARGPDTAPEADPSAASAPPAPAPPDAGNAKAISGEDLKRHIATLASDEFEGRAPATPGGEKTKAYIAAEFEKLGLEPIGGSYFQETPLVEAALIPERSSFRIADAKGAETLRYKADIVYWTKQVAESVSFDDSEIVFVGYGVVAPEQHWNDYDGVDVRGKTVVILINDPGWAQGDATLFNGKAMTYYGRWTYKYEEAARQGAAAALIVHDTAPAAYGWNVVESSWSGPQIDLKRADDGASRAKVEGWLSNDAARRLLARAGLDLSALTEAANKRGFRAVSVTGVKASADLATTIRRTEDANVVGVLRGVEAPGEYVLYTAHWDHLGNDPAIEGEDKIFNGAVDNATGIASMLAIAEKFALNPRPRRSILFAAVTAEESGLLGSAHLAEAPPAPLKSIVAGFNIDGVLPTPPAKDVIVIGHGASELEDMLRTAAEARGLYVRADLEPEKGYFYRSDHVSFAKKGVPMLYAKNGFDLVEGGEEAGRALREDYTANRYHQVSDEFDDNWPLDGLAANADLLHEVGAEIAGSGLWPNWYATSEFRKIRDESLK